MGVDPHAWLVLLLIEGFKVSCLANLTLAWGWYRLRTGRVTSANFWGVISVAMAAFYCFNPLLVTDGVEPWVIAVYCG